MRSRPYPVVATGDIRADLEQFRLELSLSGVGRVEIGTGYRTVKMTVGSAFDVISECF